MRATALALLLVATAAHAACPDLAAAPHSRWSVRTDHGVAWLVTPCGERFFSVGVNGVNGGGPLRVNDGRIEYHWPVFQPDMGAWLDETYARLTRWGFNTAGATSLPAAFLRLPFTPDFSLGRTATFHWVDPFAPAAADRLDATARELTAPYRRDPYRIGYFSDNEVGWWGGALFAFYAKQPATNQTKQRLVALLRETYADDWSAFNDDWVPPPGVASFAALERSTAATPQLRPGGDGIRVVRRWTALVAERYYALTAHALRAADPDALVLGDRLPIYYDPAAVRAMVPYVDAISTNYNVDSPDGWIARYYFDGLRRLSGGKPVLVSEWFFAAAENRTGNRNNGHLMTVRTQDDRARGAAAAARRLAAEPEIVGLHWFQYYDHPKGGRVDDGEDYNFGLVDVDDRPYDEVTAALTTTNASLTRVHAEGAHERRAAEFVLPRAAIDPTDRSLADWPHERALIPALGTAPDEVPFGDLYAAWSGAGLALAVIGMDYYDPNLLAFDDVFPREEAFRVDWGVDAGAGPRRFALYVVPPKIFPPGGSPMMQAELCRVDGSSCEPVPGAVATYFGADQPRITVEATVPWAALGVDAPPRKALRMEVAATAWHRSRWMSWSGQPPLAEPPLWHTVRLARETA